MNSILSFRSPLSRPVARQILQSCKPYTRALSTIELDNDKGDRERVVILGSGWAGFNLSRQLDPKKFQTVVVSPRPYFVFTPLLAGSAVGTLEYRTLLESVRQRTSKVQYLPGWADDVNFDKKVLSVEESATSSSLALTAEQGSSESHAGTVKGKISNISYDKLVVAVGCYSQTFGTKGVRENALFLKDVGDARAIRTRILDCFEAAALPSTSAELRKSLLNFAIVGGGPTGVEFAAELFDLCKDDMKKLYPGLAGLARISIYDVSNRILGMFDASLTEYAMQTFQRDGIKVKTEHHIVELSAGLPGQNEADSAGCFTLKTKEEGEVGVGMCVWSTGLMMNPFVQKSLDVCHTYPAASAELLPSASTGSTEQSTREWEIKRHARSGGLMVDNHFQLQLVPRSKDQTGSDIQATIKDVFAIGDVAVLQDSPLPTTAQVANQEAKWLAKRFNAGDVAKQSFTYRNLGVMTYLGNWKAIMQTDGHHGIKGWAAWVIWRGAYLTQTISLRNKILIPIYWSINWLFGRDISRF